MNNLLFEMLAAHAGGNGNPAIAEMLARLNSSSGANSTLDPQQLLAQLGNGNPLLSALGKHFAEMQANGTSRLSGPVIDVEPTPEKPEPTEQRADEASTGLVNELRQDVKCMSAELKVLRERNDLLAATLGACCLCWGQDPECRFCRGRGRPGFAAPDEAHIGEFVLPAIQMLRAQRAKVSGSSPLSKPKTTETGS